VNEPLSIDSFCEQGAKNGTSDRNYRLRSIVRHIGTTASSGHYTTDRKYSKFDELATKKSCIENGEWVTFDDGVTTPISLDRVLNNKQNQRNSYMILYELD
jgi:ubiquitin C-terminal hydrolase